MAFREKVQNALRVFVDYKKAHPALSDALQVQADRAPRHFAAKGDPLQEPVRLMMSRPRPQPSPIERYTTSAQRERVTRVQEYSAAELLDAGKLSHPVIAQAREVLGRSKSQGLHSLVHLRSTASKQATGRFSLRIWKFWNALRKSRGDGDLPPLN